MIKSIRFIVAVMLVAGPGSLARAIGSEDLKARLLREGPPRWAAHERLTERLDVRCSISSEPFGNVTAESPGSRDAYRILGRGGDLIVEVDRATGFSGACGKKGNRFFKVEKKAQGDAYTLSYIGARSDFFDEYYHDIMDYLMIPSRVGPLRLRELLLSPRFHLEEVEPDTDEGEALVRANFRYESHDELPIDGGSLRFKADGTWMIHDIDLTQLLQAGRARIRLVPEYGSVVDGFPSLVRVSAFNYGVGNPDGGTKYTCEINDWSRPELPEGRFKLAAYGLPDLDEPPTPSRSFKLPSILVAAGVCFGLVALGLRLLHGRTKRQVV